MTAKARPDDLLTPIREIAQRTPERLALLASGQPETSYGVLLNFLETINARLQALGIAADARVATMLPNAPETAVMLLALCTHATAIPLNPDEPSITIGKLLQSCRANYIVLPERFAPELLEAVRQTDVSVLVLKRPPNAAAGVFEISLADDASTGIPAAHYPKKQAALILHTSGSTNVPKRVPLSAENLLSAAWNVARSLALGETDLCLNMMPMFHIGALVDLLLAPLYSGGAVVFAPAISAATFFKITAAYRPTWFQAVPTVLREILNAPQHDISEAITGMRFIRVVSQPLPERLRQDFEARFSVPLVPIYGMTETAGVITSTPLEATQRKAGSVGPSAGLQLRIADTEGQPLPPGNMGEVQIRGTSVMAGYEAAPAEKTFQDGWFLTGDMGYLDADGFLFITGRIKDIINRGGEKIAPAELDRVLAEHSAIQEAAAFAVAHSSLGEEVGVATVCAPDVMLSEADVIAFLRARVAAHKLPRRVLFLDRLPRLPSGKLDRRGLATIAEQTFRSTRPFAEPQSALSRQIAALWCRVLKLPAVGMDDDFFDLGGDSLSATNLAQQMETELGYTSVDLFEAPTIRAMEKLLQAENPKTLSDSNDVAVVSRNKNGWKTPFFWVIRGVRHFDALAGSFDPNRPLHGLGLFLTERIRDNERVQGLARDLAAKVEAIQPKGNLLLGGFCQEGLIAFRMAQILRERGRKIALLVLQDHLPPEPYDDRVALFWSRRSRHTVYYSHAHPERGLATLFHGPVAQWGTEADHAELYHQHRVAMLARQLDEALSAAEAGPNIFERLSPWRAFDQSAYRANIRAAVPRFLRQGQPFCLLAEVTNRGKLIWEPTTQSAIVLAARWHVVDGEYPLQLDSHVELDQPLMPGQTQPFTLDLRAPMRGLPMRLEIDLVEDGIRWLGAGLSRYVLPLSPN
jgi:acyl-CoA synthetase (AMP-forming)/AMP-acid ligase II